MTIRHHHTDRAGRRRAQAGIAAEPSHAQPRQATRRSGGASRPRRRDSGYSVLEAAIVMPVVFTLTMLVIQYALVWHGRHVAQAAAQDGLRAARAFQSTPQAGEETARAYLADVAPRLLREVDVRAEATATTVTVSVDAQVLPLLTFAGISVSEEASGPRELFVTP